MQKLFLATVLAQALVMTSIEAVPDKLQVLRESGKVLRQSPVGKWLSATVTRQVASVGLAAVLACSPLVMTGCNQVRNSGVYELTDTEYVDPGDDYAGQYITLYIDGVYYEGYWEITPDNQLLIEIDNNFDRLVLLEYLKGERIPNHTDTGAEIVMTSYRNGHKVWQYGEIVDVYTNGIYIVDVWEVEYVHSRQVIAFNRPDRVATHASVLEEDGGFSFLDEIE